MRKPFIVTNFDVEYSFNRNGAMNNEEIHKRIIIIIIKQED